MSHTTHPVSYPYLRNYKWFLYPNECNNI
jgi:hypothetical protein